MEPLSRAPHDAPHDPLHRAVDEARDEIIRVCRRLDARGLIAGQDGNVSVRVAADRIVATPAGAFKGMLTAGELVELTLDGESVRGGTASSEIGMHLRLYALRPDIRAVVHAHPPTATAFAVTGVALRADVLPELIVQVGPVALVPYARSGTSALGDALEPFAAGHEAFLLANHGATTVGATLSDALIRMESLEHAARILVAASLLGGIRPLPPGEREELDALRELRRRVPGDFGAGLPPLSAHDDLQK